MILFPFHFNLKCSGNVIGYQLKYRIPTENTNVQSIRYSSNLQLGVKVFEIQFYVVFRLRHKIS